MRCFREGSCSVLRVSLGLPKEPERPFCWAPRRVLTLHNQPLAYTHTHTPSPTLGARERRCKSERDRNLKPRVYASRRGLRIAIGWGQERVARCADAVVVRWGDAGVLRTKSDAASLSAPLYPQPTTPYPSPCGRYGEIWRANKWLLLFDKFNHVQYDKSAR